MLVHITPVLLFYLVTLIAKAGSETPEGAGAVNDVIPE
jgi:hypothetical protein